MITMKRIFSIAVVLLATIVFCQGLMAQSAQVKNTEKPILPVPGVPNAFAEYSANLPKYTPSGDQGFLMVKGPVVKSYIKKTNGENESFGLDDNGWFIMSQTNKFTGETIQRGTKNRIVRATSVDVDFDGEQSTREFKYDKDGWLVESTFDGPCASSTNTISFNNFRDPISERLVSSLYSGEGSTVCKTVYTITKTDPFHNWLERDVKYYESGRLGGKWHESRTLYYLSVIDKDRGAVATRPATGKQTIGLINSKDGGIMYYHDGTQWRYCCIGDNVKLPEPPKHEHSWKDKFYVQFDPQTVKWEESYEGPTPPHKHITHEILKGAIYDDSKSRRVADLPNEFTFKAETDKLVFVKKKELEDKYFSKTPVSKGLWATLCFDDVAQFMMEPGDQSPAVAESMEMAQRLVAEMNKRSEAKNERWEYMIATKHDLDTLGIKYEAPMEDIEEAFDTLGRLYIVAASKTPGTKVVKKESYLVKYDSYYKCVNGDCNLKSVPLPHRMRFPSKERAERYWQNLQERVQIENANKPVEEEYDPTRYQEKEVKYYIVRYYTFRECSDAKCKERTPLKSYSFMFTDYTLAKRFYANAQMGRTEDKLLMLAKGQTIDEPLKPVTNRDISAKEKQKEVQEAKKRGEIEGHEHEYKESRSARRWSKKEGDKIFYYVEVTTKKTCWLCQHSEKVYTKTERFSTSREASEFYKSHMQNE